MNDFRAIVIEQETEGARILGHTVEVRRVTDAFLMPGDVTIEHGKFELAGNVNDADEGDMPEEEKRRAISAFLASYFPIASEFEIDSPRNRSRR